MREIVMDTETTGLDPSEGHKVVEIGAVELFNHLPTGKTFHQYINPKRPMPKEAFDIHGLSIDFLKAYPAFKDVAASFLDFIGSSILIIHNANFDVRFLNFELDFTGFEKIHTERVLDTLKLARKKFPGSPASLDALSRRFKVDISKREKHGALLDSQILAEIYLELIGGRQPDLELISAQSRNSSNTLKDGVFKRDLPLPSFLTTSEKEAHDKFVKSLGKNCLWNEGPK